MKIEANVWQKVAGTPSVEVFPIIPKANCVSSNCYIFSAPDALVVVDPGASPEQTREISFDHAVITQRYGVAWRWQGADEQAQPPKDGRGGDESPYDKS